MNCILIKFYEAKSCKLNTLRVLQRQCLVCVEFSLKAVRFHNFPCMIHAFSSRILEEFACSFSAKSTRSIQYGYKNVELMTRALPNISTYDQ